MIKPSFGAYKYLGRDLNDATLEYERDLMLWEQTEALKEANELREQQLNNNAEYEYELQRSKDREAQLQSQIDDLQSQLDDVYEESDDGKTHISNDTTNLEIQLAQQLNINYLLIKKLYKVIESYKDNSTTFKQILTTWIEFRQNHYEYDYEAFLEEFDYDKVITNKYSNIDTTIKPKVTGTKEDYERMIKKLIRTIMNDEGYDHVKQLQIVGL